MPIERLGVGVIGCGQAAQALHLPALASLPELFRVVHLADAAPSVAEGLAGRLGARASSDAAAVLADDEVDVVLVAAPDAFHARLAVDACRAGKRAVLVEKPLALTPGEAETVVRVSEETGVPVQVGTMHRYDPAFRRAEQLLGEGLRNAEWDLVTVECVIGPNDAFRADAVQLLRGTPVHSDAEAPLAFLAAGLHHAGADAPAGFLTATVMALTLSTHDLALLRACLGEPEAVEHLSLLPGLGYQAVLDYGRTKAVLLAYEHEVRHVDWRLRFLGAGQSVEVRFPQTWGASEAATVAVRHTVDGMLRTVEFGGRHETGFRAEWRHLHAVATGREAPLTPAADAAADVALVARMIGTGAGRSQPDPDAAGVVLLGAGWITAVHAPLLHALPEAQVAAVLSRSAGAAERRAWPYGCAAGTFGELEQVLGRDDVGVAVVAGPPAVHADHTVAALEAGCDAIVEKPLAHTLAAADRIVDAAARTGRHVAYAENYAFAPVISEARRLVAAEAVGSVRSIAVSTLHGRPTYGSFLDPAWGGGCLFDLGAHTVWWALALAGDDPPASVRAQLSSASPDEGDDHAAVEVTLASGLPVAVTVSWRQQPGEEVAGAWVEGDEGRLEVGLDPRSTLRLHRRGEPAAEKLRWDDPSRGTVGAWAGKYGYLPQLRAFLGAFREGADPWPGAGEGRLVLEVLCGAYASAGAGGEPVPLPFTGDHTATPHQLWRGR